MIHNSKPVKGPSIDLIHQLQKPFTASTLGAGKFLEAGHTRLARGAFFHKRLHPDNLNPFLLSSFHHHLPPSKMQILDNPPQHTTLIIEMSSSERQSHEEPSGTEVSSTTSLPSIPLLGRTATQYTNTEEDVMSPEEEASYEVWFCIPASTRY